MEKGGLQWAQSVSVVANKKMSAPDPGLNSRLQLHRRPLTEIW